MLFEMPEMKWLRKKSRIEDGIIVEVRGYPVEWYNPFNYYGANCERSLYLEFSDIAYNYMIDPEYNGNKRIGEFVSTYGFLGLERCELDAAETKEYDEMARTGALLLSRCRRDHLADHASIKDTTNAIINSFPYPDLVNDILDKADIISDSTAFMQLFEELKEAGQLKPCAERVDDFVYEATTMLMSINLWQAVSQENLSMTKEYLRTFWINSDEQDSDFAQALELGSKQPWITYKYAMKLIRVIVDGHLQNIAPVLNCGGLKPSFKGTWKVPNLISAMYLMLYMDMVGGKVVRRCNNETCNHFFSSNDKRKIYCSPECTSAQTQREYRRRKKTKDDANRGDK